MEIIIASNNQDKIREFREIIQSKDINFLSLAECGFTDTIVEGGKTYRENAEIKAKAVFSRLKKPVLADDSGLSVDVLDGYPGIYSARFAGESANYKTKIEHLHDLLSPYPKDEWTASFVCSLCYINQAGDLFHFEERVQGLLIDEMRGQNGFGYDPIFYLPELGLTNAEIPAAEKHARSHRGLALRAWHKALLNSEFD